MSTETATQPQSPAVGLFQKAHARMVQLQRIDEQITVLLDQRRKCQEELRQVQLQINEEFERVIRSSETGPAHLLSQIAATIGDEVAKPEPSEAKPKKENRLEIEAA